MKPRDGWMVRKRAAQRNDFGMVPIPLIIHIALQQQEQETTICFNMDFRAEAIAGV
jgi:hypothetical protein